MQKIVPFIIVFLFIIFSGCGSQKNAQDLPSGASSESQSIFPVTSFLRGQLLEIDSMPVTPLRIITVDGKSDSTWLKRADIRSQATPFLTPVIDSVNMASLFSEKSFLDQTINSFTFSYDPKATLPDSLHIRHWDVYINPQTNSVSRIYIVKEKNENNIDSTMQLTWLADKWYSIRTIEKEQGKEPKVKEMKMIWDF